VDKQIVLKYNNTATKELCGICKWKMKNTMPIGAFLEGTDTSVCDECIEKHSPEVLKAKSAYFDSKVCEIAQIGSKIKVTKKQCYGTVHGLVEIAVGTILNVQSRNSSDDGISARETITLNGQLGEKILNLEVWDTDYVVLN